jgi:hypothetical protein
MLIDLRQIQHIQMAKATHKPLAAGVAEALGEGFDCGFGITVSIIGVSVDHLAGQVGNGAD